MALILLLVAVISLSSEVLNQEINQEQMAPYPSQQISNQQETLDPYYQYNPAYGGNNYDVVQPTYNMEIPQQYNTTNMSSYQMMAVGMPVMQQQYSNSIPVQQGYTNNAYNNMQSQELYNSMYSPNMNIKAETLTPCVCGVFLSGQFQPGNNAQPVGNPVLTHEYEENYPCNSGGTKTCVNKCLDVLVKHLSNSPTIICGSIDRDCHKERAYLWIKNCNNSWVNTNLSAGREYCCKGGLPYKCPLIS